MQVCFVVERFLGHVSYFDRLRKFIETEDGIHAKYIYMGILSSPLRLLSDVAIPVLKDYDLDLHSARWQITYSYSARRQLKAMLSEDHYDAVFFHTQNMALLSRGIAEKYPLLISTDATNHLLSEMGWDGRLPFTRVTWKPSILLEKRIVKKASKLIAWSQWVRKSLLDYYGIEDERIEVIPPFVPVPEGRITKRDNEKPRLLFVGRDFRRKGGEYLLACFKEHFQDRCELHIVTTSEIQKPDNVFVYHNVSREELEHLYRTSDVFVFPTQRDCSPQVVLEAMSFELPVMTTPVGALPEMIEQGRNGLISNLDELGGFSGQLETLIEDPVLRREMGKESRKLIDEKFNPKKNAQKVCRVLREIAS